MKKLHLNQKGITLIELLLVLVLSSIILTMSTGFLLSMMKAGESTLSKTNLRNEAVLIIDSLNKALENADEFGLGDIKGQELTKVTPIKITKRVNASNVLEETRIPIPVIFSGGNLSIDGKPVNNENISLEGSHFFIAEDSSQLICKLVLKEKNTDSKPYEILKVYNLAD